jgi:pimeloyl-ACP methyl ester carboxylesterase
VLKRENIGLDDNFFAIGGHSLGLVQVLDEVERRTGVRIQPLDFMKTPTIRAMTTIARNTTSTQTDPLMVYREGDGRRGCLMLVPGFFGLSLTFRLLCQELKGSWTIVAPQLSEFGKDVMTDIDRLCEYMVDIVVPHAKNQPIHVFGYSFGGTATIKLVEILERRKLPIGVIGVFDSDPPLSPPGSFELVDPILAPEPGDEGSGTILAKSKEAMMNLQRVRKAWDPNYLYRGRAHLIQSTVEAKHRQKLQVEEWSRIYPALTVSQVASSHRDLFNFPHVRDIARTMESIL